MGRGYQKGFNRGQKGGKSGKGGRDERLVRTPELEARYNATPASASTNATHFLFCLSLYMRGFIEPVVEYLHQTERFIKFSRFMSWILRHGTELLHESSLSLTLHELFYFDQFVRRINSCRTYIEGEIFSMNAKRRILTLRQCVTSFHSPLWYGAIPRGVSRLLS